VTELLSTSMGLAEELKLIDLVLNPISHAPLQHIGDVEVELAVLVA
jgi:hypothetical protein